MSCTHGASQLGVWLGHFEAWIPLGLMVLAFLLAFRITGHNYRKAYYRSARQSPTSRGVPEPRARYTGETRLPLIVQNSHRYFYVAFLIASINSYDAIVAFHSPPGFGFGLGNIILVVNVILLWSYTGGCHSWRHLVGGRLKHFSKHPVRYWLWTNVTWFNKRHMQFTRITLDTLALNDFYIMLVASGTISDLTFIGRVIHQQPTTSWPPQDGDVR